MSVPPIPAPLEQFGERPFSFYPPILNIEHNEWLFSKATWSEALVRNTKSGMELWLPRRFLGEVSRIDEPVMIVGLRKELEFKAGTVWPTERRVIEMPGGGGPARADSAPPVPRPGRLAELGFETGAESRSLRLLAGLMALGILAAVLAVFLVQKKIWYRPVEQSALGFTARDDAFAVKRKLGEPAEERWRSQAGELQYRLLWYPQRSLNVVLMGTERDKELYIGALNKDWVMVDSVALPNGRNTDALLRALPRF